MGTYHRRLQMASDPCNIALTTDMIELGPIGLCIHQLKTNRSYAREFGAAPEIVVLVSMYDV